MKTCIVTIIKDEQSILDNFLQYHLDLGINHIFVFEDVDSTSHKNITDKYSNVTLMNILDIFKEKKKYNQYIYFINAIWYIKKNYNYDWCFYIDIDEFITVNDTTLNNVISLYKDYDALVLQWQNYNANGLINKPDYTKKHITEIYTQKVGNTCHDDQTISTKVAYNLHTFNRNNVFSNHLPSDGCKWCKPDFSNNKNSLVYDKIYIRHYITRSWEEYYYKLMIRGMFSKGHRDYDDFFSINQDMINRKFELIELAENNYK